MQPTAKALFSTPTHATATKAAGGVEAGAEDGPFAQIVASLEAGADGGEGEEVLTGLAALQGEGELPAAGEEVPDEAASVTLESDEAKVQAGWTALFLPLSAEVGPGEGNATNGAPGLAAGALVANPSGTPAGGVGQTEAQGAAEALTTGAVGTETPVALAHVSPAQVGASDGLITSTPDGEPVEAEADSVPTASQQATVDAAAVAGVAPPDNQSQGGGNSLPTLSPPPWSTPTVRAPAEGAVAEAAPGVRSAPGLQAAAAAAADATGQQPQGDSEGSPKDTGTPTGEAVAALAAEIASSKGESFASIVAEGATPVVGRVDAFAGSARTAPTGSEIALPSLDVLTLARDLQGVVQSQSRESRIALNPAELGRIDVNVRLVEGRVEVLITAQSDKGYQALSSELRGLVDALRQADIPAIVKLAAADSGDGPAARDANASFGGQQSADTHRGGSRQGSFERGAGSTPSGEAESPAPEGETDDFGPRHWTA